MTSFIPILLIPPQSPMPGKELSPDSPDTKRARSNSPLNEADQNLWPETTPNCGITSLHETRALPTTPMHPPPSISPIHFDSSTTHSVKRPRIEPPFED